MKPRVFVGSSVEGLSIARAIHAELDHDAEVTLWSHGVFLPSGNTLDDLVKVLGCVDFGIFVFSPDDLLKMRGEESSSVRDNVIFELGLFIGRLGKERSFFIMPRGDHNLHLPTDLLGVTPATFEANRSDNNLQAALSPACDQLRRVITTKGILTQSPVSASPELANEQTKKSRKPRYSTRTNKNNWWEAVEKAVQEYKKRYHPSLSKVVRVVEHIVVDDKAHIIVDVFSHYSSDSIHKYYRLTIDPVGDLLGLIPLKDWTP